MRILQLTPEAPALDRGGGLMRTYHFASALEGLGELALAVLTGKDEEPVPADGSSRWPVVLQPKAGFNHSQREKRRRYGGVRRSLSVLGAPWIDQGKELMIAGNGNCVARAEDGFNSRKHAVYAALLLRQALLVNRVFHFLPTMALIHFDAFHAVLPAVHAHYAKAAPDVIWFEHSYLYPYAAELKRTFPRARLVCNSHNVEWLRIRRIGEMKSAEISRRWMKMESEVSRRWELKMLKNCDAVLTCSGVDAQHYQEMLPGAESCLLVSPNGVDTEWFLPGASNECDPLILFAGSAGYPPNDDAVKWLIGEILPLVRRSIPNCRVCLAGLNASIHWSHLRESTPGVEVASDVPDMRPYFARATLTVVPLRSGSGTRLKILESMAMGRAVVSTTIGAEGISAIPSLDLFIADSAKDIASAVVKLIQSQSQRERMETRGRDLVCSKYRWSDITAHALQQLLDRNVIALKA